jgi:NADH:ubiquinone oxidoreductase subunit 5 (subunit L)/multisubunit Na+/H+ antiporter MnhA subunit
MTVVFLQTFVAIAVLLPLAAAAVLALAGWFGARLGERAISAVVGVTYATTTLVALGAAVGGFVDGRPIVVDFGEWFAVGHYAFRWTLLGDALSLPFSVFAAALVGLIGAFSQRYLHRETGYFRFHLMLALFGAGVQVVVLSGGIDQLFFGWELVGLTSALLIAFFHERPKPVEHGLRAFVTYRLCDIGLLGAAVWLHHAVGTAAFVRADGAPWAGVRVADAGASWTAGLLLLWASMGKSAQAPLGGWLPRAFEGPTPSSAIFYGAISIHLGPYLLLRSAPLLDANPGFAALVAVVGAVTALHGAFVGRVQTDIKCVLAYASMTQVGLILVGIGCGLRHLAVLHIVGHALVRSLEILRSPSLLQDYRHLEQAIGRQVPRPKLALERFFPAALRPWLYRHALERGYFDALLRDHLVGRFLRGFRALDRCDRKLTTWIGGSASTEGRR